MSSEYQQRALGPETDGNTAAEFVTASRRAVKCSRHTHTFFWIQG